jgi:hypothetical protein
MVPGPLHGLDFEKPGPVPVFLRDPLSSSDKKKRVLHPHHLRGADLCWDPYHPKAAPRGRLQL